jgi:hypothetical protein
MFYGELATSKGSQKINFDFDYEIILLSTEPFMRLFFDDNDDVSRFCRGRLVGFASKNDGLTALHSFVDVDLQHFFIREDLLALAVAAPIFGVDKFTSSRAVIASGLNLLNHGAHMAHHDLDTASMAAGTRPHCTVLSSLALAFGTEDITCQREFCGFALVELLQGDMYTMDKVLCFAGTLRPAAAAEKAAGTAKELAEKILQEESQ